MSIFGESYQRPVFHGGDLDRAQKNYGGEPSNWMDLSTGINPRPFPVTDIPADHWARLPGSALEQDLLAAARGYYDLPTTFQMVAAPGTQSLIQRLPTLAGENLLVAIAMPTYGEHETCWTRAGHRVIALDDATISADVVILVSPNNPTGKIYSPDDLSNIRARHLKPDGLMIVDEAFMDMSPQRSAAKSLPPENLLLLKSFGKFFGLAGLRLGFAAGDSDLIEQLTTDFGPWAVGGPAAFIGIQAFRNTVWIESSLSCLWNDSDRLAHILKEAGGNLIANVGLFATAEFEHAPALYERLCRHHILTRPFEYEASWLRFGIPKDEPDWARLTRALHQKD